MNFVVQVRLYEVLRDDATAPLAAKPDADNDGLRLVQRRRISVRRPGWEVFKLRSVIQRWVDEPSSNRGDFARLKPEFSTNYLTYIRPPHDLKKSQMTLVHHSWPSIDVSSCLVENRMWSKYAEKAKDNGWT